MDKSEAHLLSSPLTRHLSSVIRHRHLSSVIRHLSSVIRLCPPSSVVIDSNP